MAAQTDERSRAPISGEERFLAPWVSTLVMIMHSIPRPRQCFGAAVVAFLIATQPGALCQEAAAPPVPVAEKAAETKKTEEPAKSVFSPEAEKKLKEFYAKVKEGTRKLHAERMDRKVEEVGAITKLDDKGREALKEPARKAAELSSDQTVQGMEKLMRSQYRQQPEQLEDTLDQLLPQVDQIILQNGFGVSEDQDPSDEAVWTEALQRVLTSDQWATYRKIEDERLHKLRAEVEGVVKASVEWMRSQQEEYMLTMSEDVGQALSLPEERRKKLDDFARSLADTSPEEWARRVEKTLMNMPDVARKSVIKRGIYHMSTGEDSVEKLQRAWDDRISEVLTPEEIQRFASAKKGDKTQRIRAMALVMISVLDEYVAFTTAQREQLEPLADRLIAKQESLFPAGPLNQHWNVNPRSFFTAGSTATDEELAAILVPSQVARWRAACDPKKGMGIRANRVDPVSEKKDATEPVPEPEEVEGAISDFLIAKAESERERVLQTMTLKAEDAAHVVVLSDEAVTRLQTAAQGATEAAMAMWRDNTEQNVRAQLTNLNPQHLKLRLAALEQHEFYTGGRSQEKVPFWEKTIKEALDEAQLAAWNKEIAARASFQTRAAAAAIHAEFNRRFSLNADQSAKVTGFLEKFLEKYGQDVARMFSSSNSTSWFLQSYSMFLPFASLSEKELQEMLSKEQIVRLKGGHEFSNATNYWENVERQHKERMKGSG